MEEKDHAWVEIAKKSSHKAFADKVPGGDKQNLKIKLYKEPPNLNKAIMFIILVKKDFPNEEVVITFIGGDVLSTSLSQFYFILKLKAFTKIIQQELFGIHL